MSIFGGGRHAGVATYAITFAFHAIHSYHDIHSIHLTTVFSSLSPSLPLSLHLGTWTPHTAFACMLSLPNQWDRDRIKTGRASGTVDSDGRMVWKKVYLFNLSFA